MAAQCPLPVGTGGRCTLGAGSAGGGLLAVELYQRHQTLRQPGLQQKGVIQEFLGRGSLLGFPYQHPFQEVSQHWRDLWNRTVRRSHGLQSRLCALTAGAPLSHTSSSLLSYFLVPPRLTRWIMRQEKEASSPVMRAMNGMRMSGSLGGWVLYTAHSPCLLLGALGIQALQLCERGMELGSAIQFLIYQAAWRCYRKLPPWGQLTNGCSLRPAHLGLCRAVNLS